MALHSKQDISANLDDEVFGTCFLPRPLPKYRIPKAQTPSTAAYQLVHDELLLDGNSRQNVATFCQTWVEPEIRKLMDECIDKNMIDKDEYPQMAELEARCVHMLADLWHAPDAANTLGCSEPTIAAMLGHSRGTMTSRYVHVVDDTLLAAADRVAGAIARAMAGEKPAKVVKLGDRWSKATK